MSSVNPDPFKDVAWSKQALVLLQAMCDWKVSEFNARLKSPYPLLFFYNTQEETPPNPNPNP
jgi:hypothetical protein